MDPLLLQFFTFFFFFVQEIITGAGHSSAIDWWALGKNNNINEKLYKIIGAYPHMNQKCILWFTIILNLFDYKLEQVSTDYKFYFDKN